MTGTTENGIDCNQHSQQIIRDHQDLISISLSRIEREFGDEGVPQALVDYITDLDAAQNRLARDHAD